MVKTKQRELAVVPANKNNTQSGLNDSSNFNTEVDLDGEHSWVIVKKQKVTILVPSVPVAKKSVVPNLGPNQLQPVPRETVNQSQHSIDARPWMAAVDEQEKSTSLPPEKGIQISKNIPAQQVPAFAKPPMLDFRTKSENPDQVHTSKARKVLGVSDTSKAIKQPRLVVHGISGILDRSMLLNQRLRALNLERKLQRAGGLSRWLASLGLEQFVRIFQGRSVNKFQLVNLTMKKLKDMGADAVGPRRKLMHAIDCVCQPYCFEAF